MRISDWSSDVCSSDLIVEFIFRHGSDSSGIGPSGRPPVRPLGSGFGHGHAVVISGSASLAVSATRTSPWRSEEHTSELQSLMRISYAVFCLKKKITHKSNNKTNQNKYQIIHTHTNNEYIK